jgi:hypothetical protein
MALPRGRHRPDRTAGQPVGIDRFCANLEELVDRPGYDPGGRRPGLPGAMALAARRTGVPAPGRGPQASQMVALRRARPSGWCAAHQPGRPTGLVALPGGSDLRGAGGALVTCLDQHPAAHRPAPIDAVERQRQDGDLRPGGRSRDPPPELGALGRTTAARLSRAGRWPGVQGRRRRRPCRSHAALLPSRRRCCRPTRACRAGLCAARWRLPDPRIQTAAWCIAKAWSGPQQGSVGYSASTLQEPSAVALSLRKVLARWRNSMARSSTTW